MTSRRNAWVQTFESWIISALLVLLCGLILFGTAALVLLFVRNLPTRWQQAADAAALQRALQDGFGGVLVVLLGLELLETIKQYRAEHHVRLEVVFTVALIALGRHVIQIDYLHATTGELLGTAALVLALAAGFFLVRRRGPASPADGA